MGAGKSTIGQYLARRLRYAFLDTDRLLVKRFEAPIREIFEQQGEAAFRAAELALLGELSQTSKTVIATGGGALARAEAWEALGARARVVYLYAPPEVLFERVIFSPRERPMIDVPDAEARFHERFAQREPFYQRAHLRVRTDARKPEAVAAEIAEALANWPEDQPQALPGDARP